MPPGCPLPPHAPLTLRDAGAAAWASARRRLALRSHAVADAARIFTGFQALTPPATAVACRGWAHPHELLLLRWLPGGHARPAGKGRGRCQAPTRRHCNVVCRQMLRQRIAGVRGSGHRREAKLPLAAYQLRQGAAATVGTRGCKAWGASATAALHAAADEGEPLASSPGDNWPPPIRHSRRAGARMPPLRRRSSLHSSGKEERAQAPTTSKQALCTLL